MSYYIWTALKLLPVTSLQARNFLSDELLDLITFEDFSMVLEGLLKGIVVTLFSQSSFEKEYSGRIVQAAWDFLKNPTFDGLVHYLNLVTLEDEDDW